MEDLRDYVHNLADQSLQMDSSGNVDITGVLNIGTAGGIFQGTGTFAIPTTGLKIWNDGGVGRIAGYNAGTIQTYFGTDGKLYAGAGNTVLDANGMTFTPDALGSTVTVIKWISSSITRGSLYNQYDSTAIAGAGLSQTILAAYADSLVTDSSSTLTIKASTSSSSYQAILSCSAAYGTAASSQILGTINGATAFTVDSSKTLTVVGGLNVGTATGATTGQIKTSAAIYPGSTRYISDDGTYTTFSAGIKANAASLIYGGVTTCDLNAEGTALAVKSGGSGSQGGQLQLWNTYGGVSTPSKYLRINNSGELDIVNSGYSAAILNLTDAGVLKLPSLAGVGTRNVVVDANGVLSAP